MEEFRKELEELINKHSLENNSDTPDFILAEFLKDCLIAYDKATKARNYWYNKPMSNEEKREILKNTMYCQCEIPDRKIGSNYCYKCLKQISDARMRFLVNKDEMFNILVKEPDQEEIIRRRLRNDFEYNTMCARATLYPGKSIEEVKELFLHQRINEAYEYVNDILCNETEINDKKTRKWVVQVLKDRIENNVILKCDEENNSPEIVDNNLLVVDLFWNIPYNAPTCQTQKVRLVFGKEEQVLKYQKQFYMDYEMIKFIQKGI